MSKQLSIILVKAKTPVRGSSRGATRGGAIRGGAAAKPVRGKTSAPARGTPVSRGGSQPKMTTSAKKKELPATDEAKKPAPEGKRLISVVCYFAINKREFAYISYSTSLLLKWIHVSLQSIKDGD